MLNEGFRQHERHHGGDVGLCGPNYARDWYAPGFAALRGSTVRVRACGHAAAGECANPPAGAQWCARRVRQARPRRLESVKPATRWLPMRESNVRNASPRRGSGESRPVGMSKQARNNSGTSVSQ